MSEIPDAILAIGVAADDRLKARVTGLVERMLDDLEHVYETSPVSVKVQLLKSVVPVLLRELSTEQSTDDSADMRRELSDLAAEFRAQLAVNPEAATRAEPVQIGRAHV